MVTFTVKAPIDIKDGQYQGTISKVTYRTEPYEYTDIWVRIDGDEDVELKYGCPSNISDNTKLGRLLTTFGVKLVPGQEIDPEKEFKGKHCQLMTLKKSKDGKEFSEIIEDSLKPIEIAKV